LGGVGADFLGSSKGVGRWVGWVWLDKTGLRGFVRSKRVVEGRGVVSVVVDDEDGLERLLMELLFLLCASKENNVP
jgi:hypothetical protein